jgi:hypothetical protein
MAEASRTRRLPPVSGLNVAGTYFWPRGIWESQLAAQTISHYPPKEAAGLNRVYRRFEAYAAADQRAQEAWSVLAMLIGPGRELDPGSEAMLYAALARARRANRAIPTGVTGARELLKSTLGLDYPKSAGLKPIVRSAGCGVPSSAVRQTY